MGERNVLLMMMMMMMVMMITILVATHWCNTSNNRRNRDHFKIICKTPVQHTGKARNQVTAENNHIGHCTHTAESADVKYKLFNMRNNITCRIKFK
jgi:hypothetical protein